MKIKVSAVTWSLLCEIHGTALPPKRVKLDKNVSAAIRRLARTRGLTEEAAAWQCVQTGLAIKEAETRGRN